MVLAWKDKAVVVRPGNRVWIGSAHLRSSRRCVIHSAAILSGVLTGAIGTVLGVPIASLAQSSPVQDSPVQSNPVRSSMTQPAAPARSNLVQPADSYPVAAGDQLDITVADYPEFAGSKTVMPDGTIALPVVGQIAVANQTSAQIAETLTVALRHYLRNPVVTVALTHLRPVSVTVAGAVARPGPVQLSDSHSLNADQPSSQLPTIPAALAAAGGITPRADLARVQVQHGGGSSETLDLWSALSGQAATSTNLTVHDGDLIVVPERTNGTDADARLLARSVYAPKTVRVRVVGEVKRPGEVEVPPDSTLSAAVAIAGGATADGVLSRVVFMRRDEAGVLQKRQIDLRNPTDDPQVQEGDVLVVPVNNSARILDALGRVISPIGIVSDLINIFK